MKKTLSLLAVLCVLGGLLSVGSRWMSSASTEAPSPGLSPETPALPETPPTPERMPGTTRRDPTAAAEARAEPGPPPPPVFVTRGVMGRIVDREGTPVEGARVSCSLTCGEERTHLGWTRSEEGGGYALEVPLAEEISNRFTRRAKLLAWLERSRQGSRSREGRRWSEIDDWMRRDMLESLELPLVLEVTASASKKQRAVRRLHLGTDRPELLRVDLVLETCFVFGGRVLWKEARQWRDERVAGVALLDRDWHVVDTTRTGESGEFEFGTPDPGFFNVHARQEGFGAGVTAGFHLAPELGSPNLKVPLDGEGTLRGQVLLPDGEPVVGLQLVATQDGLVAANPDHPEQPDLSALAQAEASGGLAFSHAVTDREGRFWMEAMQRGNYILRFEGLGDDFQPVGPFSTGPEHDLEYTARLLTVLVDTSRATALLCRVHCLEEGRSPPPGDSPKHSVRPLRDGRAVFVVEEGTNWLVWCEYRGRKSEEERVIIGARTFEEFVELELPEEEPEEAERRNEHPFVLEPPEPELPGTLVVDLLDEDGRRQPTSVTLWHRAKHGETRLFESLSRKAGMRMPPLEPGNYRVIARARGEAGATLLPAEGTVTLSPGAVERLSLRPERGGRLALELKLAEEHFEEYGERLVQLVAFPEGGKDGIRLSFVPRDAPSAAPRPMALPGRALLCDPPLSAGKYRLEILSLAFDVEPISLELEGGETASRSVELVPRQAE